MQLRLKPQSRRSLISKILIIKITLFLLVFSLAIFLVDKIDFPTPTKHIEKVINNDKLITLK
tara:strand:+ start:56 stop:241 length:186 start_codon:yes stop_codon:yes gene_type:complete